MRTVPLTAVKGGINRLRVRGGARADNLYELLNGYVTASKTVVVRPGTYRRATLPDGTKGLTSFRGELHTFSPVYVDPATVPDGYVVNVIQHPDATTGSPIAIEKIWFAQPYLGFLYVVAEFVNGDVYHFWLQSAGDWTANNVYHAGDVIEPTVANGLAYQASRLGQPYASWRPNTPYTEGPPADIVEPTVYNDFYYTVVETTGANPTSGSTEPDWPTEPGARVTEETDGTVTIGNGVTEPPEIQTPPEEVQERYGRPGPNGRT